MENDYISRAELENWLLDESACLDTDADKACVIERLRKAIPAADVRPVARGEWIDYPDGRWVYAQCSECKTVHDVKSNFCPHCGADMRPEGKEAET